MILRIDLYYIKILIVSVAKKRELKVLLLILFYFIINLKFLNEFIQNLKTGILYKCLYCENVELCSNCFNEWEHFDHNKFLMKETIY